MKPFRFLDRETDGRNVRELRKQALKCISDSERLEVRLRIWLFFLKTYIVAVIAVRIHLFPFRTEKLSSPSPMVLPHQVGE